MKVAVIGAGYVGLTTAAVLAHIGHEVLCVDVDRDKVERLRQGEMPIYERHLQSLVEGAGTRLGFTHDTVAAVSGSQLIMITVGTPSLPDGSADLAQMDQAVAAIAAGLGRSGRPCTVVVKSTAPVGNCRRIRESLRLLAPDATVAVAVNPEFLPQGSAVRDSLYPDRIVIGSDDPSAIWALKELYAPIIRQDFPPVAGMESPDRPPAPVLVMDPNSAELAKYAANAFLAMKISFINEMANVAELAGADVGAIAGVLSLDPRIGGQHLRAGIGYGGSCFPKDTRALHELAGGTGYDFKLLRAVIEVNNQQWQWVERKLRDELGSLEGKRIALLGLAFKPGTDDVRESLALVVGERLHRAGATVTGYDPAAGRRATAEAPWLTVCESPEAALAGADAVALVTDWPQFRELNWEKLVRSMRHRLILDGRRLLAGLKLSGAKLLLIGSSER